MKRKKINNVENYSRLKKFLTLAIVLGFVFQFISGVTEANGIYNFGKSHGVPMWGIWVGVAIIAIGWEMSIRMGLKYCASTSIRWMNGVVKFKWLEAVLFGLMLVVTVVITDQSFRVSKENSEYSLNIFYKTFKKQTNDAEKTEAKTDLTEIERRYNEKRQPILSAFKADSIAAVLTYTPLIEKAGQDVTKWREKEKINDKNYITYITRAKGEAKKQESLLAGLVADLTRQKNAELSEVENWRSGQEGIIDGLKNTAIASTANTNTEKERLYQEWMTKYSGFWAHFAGLSVLLGCAFIIMGTIIEELSEIEETVIISREDEEPGLLSDLWALLILSPSRYFKDKIRSVVEKSKDHRAFPTSIIEGKKTEKIRGEESADIIPIRMEGTNIENDRFVKTLAARIEAQNEKLSQLENENLSRKNEKTLAKKPAQKKEAKKPQPKTKNPFNLKGLKYKITKIEDEKGFSELDEKTAKVELLRFEKNALRNGTISDAVKWLRNAQTALKKSAKEGTRAKNLVKANWLAKIVALKDIKLN